MAFLNRDVLYQILILYATSHDSTMRNCLLVNRVWFEVTVSISWSCIKILISHLSGTKKISSLASTLMELDSFVIDENKRERLNFYCKKIKYLCVKVAEDFSSIDDGREIAQSLCHILKKTCLKKLHLHNGKCTLTRSIVVDSFRYTPIEEIYLETHENSWDSSIRKVMIQKFNRMLEKISNSCKNMRVLKTSTPIEWKVVEKIIVNNPLLRVLGNINCEDKKYDKNIIAGKLKRLEILRTLNSGTTSKQELFEYQGRIITIINMDAKQKKNADYGGNPNHPIT